MIKTRTARRFLAATTLSAIAFVGIADVAGATPVPQGPGQIGQPQGGTDPTPDGPVVIVDAPDTDPQPDPPAPEPELPIGQPSGDDDPDPVPHPDFPLEQPTGHGDPEPDPDLPVAQPEAEPDVNPDIDLGPEVLGADLGCTFTHGCPEDEPGQPDEPKNDDGTEVESGPEDRGSLPRTGAGIALLGGLGSVLVAGGAAAKRAAKR